MCSTVKIIKHCRLVLLSVGVVHTGFKLSKRGEIGGDEKWNGFALRHNIGGLRVKLVSLKKGYN